MFRLVKAASPAFPPVHWDRHHAIRPSARIFPIGGQCGQHPLREQRREGFDTPVLEQVNQVAQFVFVGAVNEARVESAPSGDAKPANAGFIERKLVQEGRAASLTEAIRSQGVNFFDTARADRERVERVQRLTADVTVIRENGRKKLLPELGDPSRAGVKPPDVGPTGEDPPPLATRCTPL